MWPESLLMSKDLCWRPESVPLIRKPVMSGTSIRLSSSAPMGTLLSWCAQYSRFELCTDRCARSSTPACSGPASFVQLVQVELTAHTRLMAQALP